MSKSDLLKQAEESFISFLKARRMRKTPERLAILAEVCSMGAHFDVEDVYSTLDEKGYHVSRATVYSTIELLCQCGIVRRLLFNMHQSYYELTGRNHIHLVCTECGVVREADAQDSVVQPSRKLGGFTVAYSSTTLFGLCSKCARKARAFLKKKK